MMTTATVTSPTAVELARTTLLHIRAGGPAWNRWDQWLWWDSGSGCFGGWLAELDPDVSSHDGETVVYRGFRLDYITYVAERLQVSAADAEILTEQVNRIEELEAGFAALACGTPVGDAVRRSQQTARMIGVKQ
jgi:hypothetical protein